MPSLTGVFRGMQMAMAMMLCSMSEFKEITHKKFIKPSKKESSNDSQRKTSRKESKIIGSYVKILKGKNVPNYIQAYCKEHLLVDSLYQDGHHSNKWKYELRIHILKTYCSDYLHCRSDPPINDSRVYTSLHASERARVYLMRMFEYIRSQILFHHKGTKASKHHHKKNKGTVFIYQIRNAVCSFFKRKHSIHLATD